MRGRPLVEWIAFLALWLILLVPLTRLTAVSVPLTPQPEHSEEESGRKAAWFSLRFSAIPRSFTLMEDGHVLWEGTPETEHLETALTVRVTRARAEFRFEAEWDEAGGVKAVELVIEPEGEEFRSETLWVEGSAAEEIIVYKW